MFKIRLVLVYKKSFKCFEKQSFLYLFKYIKLHYNTNIILKCGHELTDDNGYYSYQLILMFINTPSYRIRQTSDCLVYHNFHNII